MKLWCEKCHTCWVELIFCPGDKCPFKDCTGRLSETKPKAVITRPRRKRDKTRPLFDVAS